MKNEKLQFKIRTSRFTPCNSFRIKKNFKKIKKELPGVKKNVSLKKYSTFKIGGRAQYFFQAKNKKELIKAIKTAKELKLPFFILGGGSNVLISDKGFKGLVIKMQGARYKIQGSSLWTEAGVSFSLLVKETAKRGLSGLEWAGGLPGSFGGAVRGNAGAFGGETKDAILKVEALDGKFNYRFLSKKQCRFSYRNSIFKKKNWIVLSADLKMKKGNKKELQKIVQSRIDYRKKGHPLEYPNAGSIFKNISFKKVPPKFQKDFLDRVKNDPFPIVPAAWFIIGAGLVGKKVGRAQVSTKHSNYIVNLGGARAEDVIKLINLVKKKVKKKFGIKLEEEIQRFGF